MSETPTETKEWTFDLVWEDFVAQLLAAREEVKTKEDELETVSYTHLRAHET